MSQPPTTTEDDPQRCNCADYWQNFESFLARCNERQICAMLYAVELRLGTPAELPSDLDRAQAIAHRLNNLLTQASLRRALEELSPGGAVPGSAHADETGAKA